MSHIISPVGLATTALVANQVSILAEFTEKLARKYCIYSSIQPQYTIVYTAGTPVLNGTSVFVPITAVITIVTPSGTSAATTQLFTERFNVAFQGQTAVPTSVTIASVGRTASASSVKCCVAGEYTISDSLTITIA